MAPKAVYAQKPRKKRLDDTLIEQGFCATREEALRLVMAGLVSGEHERYTSAAALVNPAIRLHVKGQKRFVSRGGEKLSEPLSLFHVDVRGKICLDVGCSTGGFTDCLLQAGAAQVTSVDVGYAQFDYELRNDPRVTLLERTNITALDVPERTASVDVAVCDVSFTSVTVVLPTVAHLLRNKGIFVCLVKPQFEALKAQVDEGGVVHSTKVWQEVLERVAAAFVGEGFSLIGTCKSPISGHKGNTEFFLVAQKNAPLTSKVQNECFDFAKLVTAGETLHFMPLSS